MSITSHSKTLLSTRPQLIPGMSLSDCICCSWRDSMRPAGDVAIVEGYGVEAVPKKDSRGG
jgi:hypothetical protein